MPTCSILWTYIVSAILLFVNVNKDNENLLYICFVSANSIFTHLKKLFWSLRNLGMLSMITKITQPLGCVAPTYWKYGASGFVIIAPVPGVFF
jgi:hypothetical protein